MAVAPERHPSARVGTLSFGPFFGEDFRAGTRRNRLGSRAGACPGEVGSGSPIRTCAKVRIYSASPPDKDRRVQHYEREAL
jgi:hypothetical protein